MSNKILKIISIMLIESLSFVTAKVGLESNNDKANSHVWIEHNACSTDVVSTPVVPENIEYDVILSKGLERRNAYNTGRDTPDTLFYCPGSFGQFIFDPGEYLMLMYKMPGDGIITGINIPVFAWGTGDQLLEVSLWKVTYPYGSDGELYETNYVDVDGWVGYYWDGVDTLTPYFVIDGYSDYWGDDSIELGPCAMTEPVPYAQDLVLGKIWPPNDVYAILDPDNNPAQQDNWIATEDYGNEPEFMNYEWIGILVKSAGIGGGDDDATGFYYCEGDGLVDPWVFAKFYNQCNGTSGEGGWHIRHWVLDFLLAVEFGCVWPWLPDYVCPLPTTLSTEDRTACVELHYYDLTDTAYVDSVVLSYSLDNENWVSTQMYLVEGDSTDGRWEGIIPGQPYGTEVWWNIEYWGVPERYGETFVSHYFIFQATQPNLFINNSYWPDWIGTYYFYGLLGEFDYDIWNGSWSTVTYELLQYYDTVVDIQGGGPEMCSEGLDVWLDEGGKNLIISGDEYLGACFYGWPDDPVIIPDTDFVYQYLGVSTYYPDINYTQSGDQYGISRLITVEGDFISDSLYEFLGDSLFLNYDPNYEIGAYNWLDGIEPVEGANVSYYGVTGVLDSNFVPTGTDTLPTAVYYELDNGSKTAFFAFDVLSLNSMSVNAGALHDTSQGYYWIGIYPEGPIPQALLWMDAYEQAIDEEIAYIPGDFYLYQNYPNPFNPVTTIRYNLPEMVHVQLTIYNLLGREVAVLVDKRQQAGYHSVTWNGRDRLGREVGTGVYIYQLKAGVFMGTKKVLLVK